MRVENLGLLASPLGQALRALVLACKEFFFLEKRRQMEFKYKTFIFRAVTIDSKFFNYRVPINTAIN